MMSAGGNLEHIKIKSLRKGSHDELYALVHTQIAIDEAMRIPGAKKALDGDWSVLQDEEKAWDLDTARENHDVVDEAREKL